MTDDEVIAAEIQEHADRIVALLGHEKGLKSGQLLIHFNDFLVQRAETNNVYRLLHTRTQLTRPTR
jgi:hypothetical protein